MRFNEFTKQPVSEGMLDNPGADDSPVAQAIIRRILLQRTDLLSKYGPEKVGQAVDEVAGFVGDVDEIGSSDVSGWIRHVEQMLGDGVAEGAPIVVMPRADRLKKAEPTKVRYQGDIVPPTKPPSTEKRGVKGRPGQRPMPEQGVAEGSREQVDSATVWEVSFDYGPHQSDKVKVRASSQEEAEQKGMRAAKKLGHRFPQLNWAMPAEQGVAEGIMNKIANKVMGAAPEQPRYRVGQRVKYETSPDQPDWKDGGRGVGVITAYKNGHYMINGNPVNHFEIKGVVDQGVAEGYDDEEHPIRDDGNEGRPGKQRYPGKLPNKEQGVAEAEKKLHPKTWHDVDKKLGKAVDKMSQAEKVAKGLAHPDTLKKQGVAEGYDERKQNALWAQITAHEKAAKASKDLKRQHHLKMANQLRSQLKSSDNEQGVAEGLDPEQEQMDANRSFAQRREREHAGSEKIDAALAAQDAQRREYEQSGKFWLKYKDSQKHVSAENFIGKAAANAAAQQMIRAMPEVKGNLLITAYGPNGE